MYGNPEVGPSSQAFPPFPYETRPTAQPPGWISETTANADQEQLITEEDEVPVNDFYCSLILRVTNRLLGVRNLRPGVPLAKGRHVPTVSATMRTYSSSGNGGRLPEDPGRFLATWKRSLVSTHPILRNVIPDLIDCNPAVTEIISGLLEPVYNEDRLSTGRGSRTKVGSRRADKEFERRNGTREVYQRLSRYYILQGKRSRWDATELLVEGKHGCDR